MAHPDPELDVSYLSLRKSIGWIALLMPVVVRLVARWCDGTGWLQSVSAYYFTAGRDIFVGSLFAAGLFLCFYRGSSRLDRGLAIVWGLAGIFIGLVPLNPCSDAVLAGVLPQCQGAGPAGSMNLHLVPVTVFFATSIFMTLFRFPKPSQPLVTHEKEMRNKVYRACGIAMIGLVLIIGYLTWQERSVWVPEALVIALMGVAWLVKGQFVLADQTRS